MVVFTDPVLGQKIANSRDRAAMDRQRVRGALLAEKAAHESRRIVHNIRLGAQRQMAIEAKKYYKSPAVQSVLQETAVSSLQDVLRQAGINVMSSTQALPGGDRSEIDKSEAIRQPNPRKQFDLMVRRETRPAPYND